MSDSKVKTRPAAYGADFYAWTQEQAAHLRGLRPNSIDWENLAEEVETLGRSEKREIRSRMLALLTHLLKWRYQANGRRNSWKASVAGARDEIGASPSLRRYPAEVLAKQYALARLEAAGDTGLDLAAFPETCPFTIDEVFDRGFWPDASA